MKRSAIVVAVVAVVVGLVGAGLAIATQRGGIVEPQTLSFAVGGGHAETADVGPAGDSPGDTFLAQGKLLNFALTKQFGRFNSACELENLTPRWNHCTATVLLPNGTVELSARFVWTDTRPGYSLAVIGGTGSYDNVVGQGRITFGCDACPAGTQDVDTLTLQLIPSFERP
jgi:hypothetical protein